MILRSNMFYIYYCSWSSRLRPCQFQYSCNTLSSKYWENTKDPPTLNSNLSSLPSHNLIGYWFLLKHSQFCDTPLLWYFSPLHLLHFLSRNRPLNLVEVVEILPIRMEIQIRYLSSRLSSSRIEETILLIICEATPQSCPQIVRHLYHWYLNLLWSFHRIGWNCSSCLWWVDELRKTPLVLRGENVVLYQAGNKLELDDPISVGDVCPASLKFHRGARLYRPRVRLILPFSVELSWNHNHLQ